MRLVGTARSKTFDPADNDKFLELKGVIVQELEVPRHRRMHLPSHGMTKRHDEQNYFL